MLYPELEWGANIFSFLFEFGPAHTESPITVHEWAATARELGLEWQPGDLRLLFRLSREYLAETRKAMQYHAPPPWPGAVAMWKWVRNRIEDKRLDAFFE